MNAVKHSHGRHAESGFTLIEVVISVVLLTLITSAITTVLVASMKLSASTTKTANESSDGRLIAGYLVRDAQAAGGTDPLTATTDGALSGFPITGLPATTPAPGVFQTGAPNNDCLAAGTPIIRFDWNERTSSPTTTTGHIVVYSVASTQLIRTTCVGGGAPSAQTLGHHVASACYVPFGGSGACAASAQNTVSLTITETTNRGNAAAPYTFTLTASLRPQSETAPAVGSAPAPLVLLGRNTCGNGGENTTGLGVESFLGLSVNLHVFGQAYINATDHGCKAMNLTSGATYEAASTAMLQGGTCGATNPSVCPPASMLSSYNPALADPYANLAVPAVAGNQSGCGVPGVYANTLTVSSGTCTLSPGIYILNNGVRVTGGTLRSSGGVLLYIKGGSFSVSGSGRVDLTAATSGPYAGLVLWQNKSDASNISFGGSAGTTNSLRGTIYAPSAEVSDTFSAASTVNVGGIVAQTLVVQVAISFSGAGGMNIGTDPGSPPHINAASLPPWTVGQPSYPGPTLTATGGAGQNIWSSTDLAALGLTIDPTTGAISGTPTATTNGPVAVTVTDVAGQTDTATLPLTISPLPTITTASPLPPGEFTVPYTVTLARSGGTAPFTWSETGALPGGLTLNAGTGTISGTPTSTGTFPFTVTLTDHAGAAVTKSFSLTINPQPSIKNVQLKNKNGGVSGTIEQGDTITVTFSGQMKVASFCSAWVSGDTNGQSLQNNGDVTVSLTDGGVAAHDTMSVSSASCAFNFGSIDLGSTAYVTGGSATFAGNSFLTRSTIVWTPGNSDTLVITLGAKAGPGTIANVPTNTSPTYTASGAIKDSAGATLNPLAFPLPAGKQF